MPNRPPVRGTEASSIPRRSAHARGYTRKWRNERGTGAADAFLREHPLCADCERRGLIVAAVHVDHIRPHRGNMTLFWNEANWQSLCACCHAVKTRKGL